MITSQTSDGSSPHKCPFCSGAVVLPTRLELTDFPCPNCGMLFWYINVREAVFVFDPNGLSHDDWAAVRANIPVSHDDSMTFVEKLMFLESHSAR